MSAPPRVAVIIPNYNRARLVVEAIASVLAQTYRDLEVLVYDDGSTDDTAERIGGFGPSVRYVRLPHSAAPGRAMNRGIAEARGELVAFLDDDDLWDPPKLERQVALLDRRPELDAVYCDCRVVDPDGLRIRIGRAPDPDAEGRLLQRVLGGKFPSSCALLARRTALARAPGFDETTLPGYDFPFWLSFARVARVARLPEPLVCVRQQDGSHSKLRPDLIAEVYIGALERELGARDLTGVQRLHCRRTLAVQYAQLANARCLTGGPGAARAALRGIRTFPASRNALKALGRALMVRAPGARAGRGPLGAGGRNPIS